MNILIRNCSWVNPGDSLSGKLLSLRIREGKLVEFGDQLQPKEEEVLDADGWFCSPGWLDLIARTGAPGRPENESLDTFFSAAASGGFTRVHISPDTRPVLQTVEAVRFFKDLDSRQGVKTLVSAAATQDLAGKKMAEFLTLHSEGAVSFSTVRPVSDAGFLARILQYLRHSGVVLFNSSWDSGFSSGGQIHEGVVSDRRGLQGIPSIAEFSAVQRDISILQYAGGKLHFPCISAAESLAVLKTGKEKNEGLSFSVAAHQLCFTHENLLEFDTIHKVFPPYRTENDRQALIGAIQEGLVDAIVSDHQPLHYDYKEIEFENAAFGISSLETTYSALMKAIPELSPSQQVRLLCLGPARILGLEIPHLKEGNTADFTLFSPEGSWIPGKGRWNSRSLNNPFIGQPVPGRILGIVTEKGFFRNQNLGPSK